MPAIRATRSVLTSVLLALSQLAGNAQAADSASTCRPVPPQVVPADVRAAEFQSQAGDGTCLQGYVWQPPEGSVRGVVIVVHGIRDHATRYLALARGLVEQKVAVVAQDHRGHGSSGGARQRFDSIEQVRSDVELGVAEARRRFPGVPVFVFGHSMGGLTAVTMGLATPQAYKGIVLSGPALKLGADATATKKALVHVLGRIWPSLAVQPVDDSLFVREAAAKQAQASDPLIDHSDLPAASALAFLRGIEALQSRLGEFAVPLLDMHGTADQSTDPAGSRELVARAASADKTLREVSGAAHDLLHEPEADQLVREIVAWVVKRL